MNTSRLAADDRPASIGPDWRFWLAGFVTLPAVGLALTTATVFHWPDISGLLTIERIFENLVPQLAVVGGFLALVLLGLGWRWLALCLICLNLAGGAQVAARIWKNTDPPLAGAPVDATVLWFNLLKDNPLPADRLIAALVDSPADIIILGEAVPLRTHLDDSALTAAFPVQTGCRQRRCEVLVLARDPEARISIRNLYPPRVERMVRVEIGGSEERPALTVLGMHFYKPWYFGLAEHDNWYAVDEIGASRGPLAVVGDFNAAPWSHRLRTLYHLCGVKGLRWPMPTWPAGLGPLGVSLDQVLTRSGARVVAARTWGAGLGSNHDGLLVDLAITDTPPQSGEDCRIPLGSDGYPLRPVQP